LHYFLGEEFVIGAAGGFFLEKFHDSAHFLFGGGANFGDAGRDESSDFIIAETGGQILFEDDDFGGFFVGEVLSLTVHEALDGILALFDLFSDDGEGVGIGEFGIGAALFDGGVFEGGLQGSEDGEGGGVFGLHRDFNIFHDLIGKRAHGRMVERRGKVRN
jgi:hypothetical protein